MDITKLVKPNVSEENAIDLVRSIYGLEVIYIRRMASFNDQNFFIQVSKDHQNLNIDQVSETGYTLKIINTMKSSLEGHFESLHSAMRHLSSKGLRVPLPVKDLNGNTFNLKQVPLLNKGKELPEPQKCGVHLLIYLPGIPVVEITPTKEISYQWGLLLAKFHQALQDFVSPSLKMKKIFYGIEHSIPAMKSFTIGLDEERLNMVDTVMEHYSKKITPNYENISKGFIHGDFNNYNILAQKEAANGETLYHVDGILDFEDMHYGTYIWDIGLMLAHTMLEPKDMTPVHAAGYTLAGYLSLRKLTELELSLIKTCIECRLCMSAVYCHYGIQTDPDNAYISELSQDLRWNRLRELLNIKDEDLLKQWKIIFKEYP